LEEEGITKDCEVRWRNPGIDSNAPGCGESAVNEKKIWVDVNCVYMKDFTKTKGSDQLHEIIAKPLVGSDHKGIRMESRAARMTAKDGRPAGGVIGGDGGRIEERTGYNEEDKNKESLCDDKRTDPGAPGTARACRTAHKRMMTMKDDGE
jgi:hypothetical protein